MKHLTHSTARALINKPMKSAFICSRHQGDLEKVKTTALCIWSQINDRKVLTATEETTVNRGAVVATCIGQVILQREMCFDFKAICTVLKAMVYCFDPHFSPHRV